MDARRIGCILVFAVSFVVFSASVSARRQRGERLFDGLSGSGSQASVEVDEYTAEQLWFNCRQDLMHGKEAVKNSNLFLLDEIASGSPELNLKLMLSLERSLQKAVTHLPPQMEHFLLYCLSKQSFLLRVSGEEDGSRYWYTQYLESLLGWHATSRRHLGDQSFQDIALAPDLAVQLISYVPEPFSNSQSPVTAPRHSFYPLDPHETHSSSSSDFSPLISLEKHNISKRVVAIAVIVTAGGTFLFAGILFYCYHRCCGNNNGSWSGQKDERHLLALSLSNFSAGSSPKSTALENSVNKEKTEDLSFRTNRSQNGRSSSLQSNHLSKKTATPNYSPNKTIFSVAISGIGRSSTHPSTASSDACAPIPPPPPMMPPTTKTSPPPPGPPPPPPMIHPTTKTSHPPPGPPRPPPIATGVKPGSHPLPPPKGTFPSLPPQSTSISSIVTQPSPVGPNHPLESGAPKAKLKPLFWDKVLTKPDHSMVWHQISSGSFQFNEEIIESLFGYNSADTHKSEHKKESPSHDTLNQYVQILDPKKSQNLAILLRALNVTIEEVCDALLEGNELPIELLQNLLKMAPTAEEGLKLKLYSGDLSHLGLAERFLKALVDIPFAFKRLDALLYMSAVEEEVLGVKESFATLEGACKELKNSRLFLKLLEAVLKTGNRMNDGTFRGGAKAFKLDTLLKLSDVRGADGKTTLLHFVVQEIIRSEGVRAAYAARESSSISSLNSDNSADDPPSGTEDHYHSLGLEVVASLGNELENVSKAAALDADALKSTVVSLGHGLVKTKEFLKSDLTSIEDERGFHRMLKCFIEHVEGDVTWMLDEEKRIRSLVKSTTNYFHGNAGTDEGLRLFVIVRDFLGMLDKACKEVKESPEKAPKIMRNKVGPTVPSFSSPRPLLFPAIRDRQVDGSSSDEESLSP